MQAIDFQIPLCPKTLAREGANYHVLIQVEQLPRYASMLERSGPVEANIVFGRDEDGVFIDTAIKANPEILCQFCLTSFPFLVESNTRFRPVPTLEAAREISDDNEPVLYENGFVNIINMLEDDALLALPTYPKCKECNHPNKGDTILTQFAIMPGAC